MTYFLITYKVIPHSLNVQIDELEPLFEPQPVSFSFNTPAWFVLGGLLIVFLTYISIIQLKKYNKNRYRRDGLKLLNSFHLSQSNDVNISINEIRVLLKQVAIQRYGRQKVASLYGEDWLQFLESKGENTPFLQNSILVQQDIFLNTEKEKKELIDLVIITKKWIKTHA